MSPYPVSEFELFQKKIKEKVSSLNMHLVLISKFKDFSLFSGSFRRIVA